MAEHAIGCPSPYDYCTCGAPGSLKERQEGDAKSYQRGYQAGLAAGEAKGRAERDKEVGELIATRSENLYALGDIEAAAEAREIALIIGGYSDAICERLKAERVANMCGEHTAKADGGGK